MASVVKHGKGWRAHISIEGRRVSRTFPRRADAVHWAAITEAEMRAGVVAGGSARTLRDALERYQREVVPTRRGARWEGVRVSAWLRDLPADLLGARLDAITAADLAGWRDSRLGQVSPGTVDREITLLRGVFRLARREWQWMTGDPWVDVARPKQPPPRDRRISEEEIQAILTACGYCEGARPDDRYQETAVLFLLAIETAMRAGELVGLAWDRVDLDRRVATLEQTKNGTGRRVPLSSRAVELLRSLEGLHPVRCVAISSSVLDATFRRARWRAGIEGLTFHDTRHEAITRLARRLDLLDLARMVGHRDPRSLMIYYNATAEELAGRLG